MEAMDQVETTGEDEEDPEGAGEQADDNLLAELEEHERTKDKKNEVKEVNGRGRKRPARAAAEGAPEAKGIRWS